MQPNDRARRFRTIAGWSLVGAAAVIVAIGVVVALTRDDEGSGPSYRFATERFVNQEGRYSFYHPPDWEVEEDETVTRVLSPEEHTSVTFGLGAEGDLEAAETEFVERVQATYRRVELFALQQRDVGPYPALSVAGIGTNPEGVRVRFLAITVRAGERNYSIGVFTAAGSDPDEVVPPTQEIVNSFRRLPSG
ncbi:MAG TPA: hypothetical protein VHL78_01150 [Actinomycetota bacterium]|nr:hypothetical protein [Actinomycetota bacterium]